MQLPQELQHFPHKALVVASDTVSAKFWIVANDAMEELDGLSMPHERATDHETGPNTGNEDEERFHHYLHELTDRIAQLTHQHEIMHVHLAMNAEIEHGVTHHLPRDVQEKIGKRVHADLMNASPLDILHRILGI